MRNDSTISTTTTTGKLPPKCDGLQNYNPGDNVILIKDCSDTKSNWRIGEHGVVIESASPSTHGQVLVRGVPSIYGWLEFENITFLYHSNDKNITHSYHTRKSLVNQRYRPTRPTQVQFRNTHETFDQVYVYTSSLNILSDSSWISHAKSIRGVRLVVTGTKYDTLKGFEGLYFEVRGPETSPDRYYYVSDHGYIIHRDGTDITLYSATGLPAAVRQGTDCV